MPRYLVERSFPDDITLPTPQQDMQSRLTFLEHNALDGVTWVHSYIAPDRKRSFCIYDAPTPEAVRRAALRNGVPVDRIHEVYVLDPYFYRG